MFITKKHLSRRTVLKGVGRDHRAAAARRDEPGRHRVGADGRRARRRSGSPSSASRTAPSWTSWSPAQTGTRLRDVADPRAAGAVPRAHDDRLGAAQQAGRKPGAARLHRAHLASCVKPMEAGVAGPDAGVTADQFAARHIGQDTRLPSLELTTALRGAQLAWRTPTQSLPQEGEPARGVPAAVRPGRHRRRARGDSPRDRQHPRPRQGAGGAAAGRARRSATAWSSSDYLDSVREIERRVQMAPTAGHLATRDSGRADRHAERHRRALQADVRSDGAGVPGGHHARHHVLDGSRGEHAHLHQPRASPKRSIRCRITATIRRSRTELVQIQRYHTKCSRASSSGWRRRRKATARVLDHSTILFGSNMSNSNRHNNDPLPVGDPRPRARPHQRRPALEVSAGLALRRPAGDAVRPHANPGREDRRQRRHALGGLASMHDA